MIVKPKIRGFICTTAHPKGCAAHVQEQIDYVKAQAPFPSGPKNVLVIGASTGYGLSSRICAAFGCGAATIGVFFEKQAENDRRTATAGWYNSVAFEEKARRAGLYAKSFNGDAFSDEMRQQVVKTIKKDWGKVDLIIYSLASPRRQDPKTKEVYKSVLKPIGQDYTNNSIDLSTNQLEVVTLPQASEEEIRQTVAVMGGDDWRLWIEALFENDLLAENTMTVAYSYIGPQITNAVYRNGTIGKAKDNLEETAKKLDQRLKSINGRALVSVNKALVTQSSSAIPFIPLYFILLNKVMTQKNIAEDCIQQICRMFKERLYGVSEIPVDEAGRVRLDDLELREDVQQEVMRSWDAVNQDNLSQLADLDGYHRDFLKLFGFGLADVDYDEDVRIDSPLPSAQ